MANKPYVPTGRPPGRPKKPEVERQGIQDVRARFRSTTQDPATMPLDAICPDCFPNGWDGITRRSQNLATTACLHGVWVLRL